MTAPQKQDGPGIDLDKPLTFTSGKEFIMALDKSRRATKEMEPKVELWHVRDAVRDEIIESFPDETGEGWAYYRDGSRKRLESVEGERFKDYVRITVNELARQPREGWVEPIVKLCASEARRGRKRKLHLRQATTQEGAFVLQLSPEKAVVVAPDRLEVIDAPPIFRNFSHQLDLDVDLTASVEDLNLLDRYTHFASREEAGLFKDVIAAYFVPGIAKPIQMFRGPPGAAKSTSCRLIKTLIDPSASMRLGIPYPANEGDWQVVGRKHLVIFLDNLGYLEKTWQDELCRVVTGKSIEKRKLYTDSDSVSDEIKAIPVVNAIDLTNLNSDLLDRAIIWELLRITDDQRIPEEEMNRALERDLPRIRGAMLKVLQRAMTIVKDIEAPNLRLKDFARWAAACAQARGTSADEFAAQLHLKVELQADESIAQNQLTAPLASFMERRTHWEGSAKMLLDQLTEQEYGTGGKVPKEWFHTPVALGMALKRIQHLLPRLDIRYRSEKGAKGVRSIVLEKENSPATPATQKKIPTEDMGGNLENQPATHLPPATQEGGEEAGVATYGGSDSPTCHPDSSTTKTVGWQPRQEKREKLSVVQLRHVRDVLAEAHPKAIAFEKISELVEARDPKQIEQVEFWLDRLRKVGEAIESRAGHWLLLSKPAPEDV